MDSLNVDVDIKYLIRKAGKDAGCAELLDSFPPEYLEYAFKREYEKKPSLDDTPEDCAVKVISNIKRVFSVVEKFNKYCQNMDKALFTELMMAENFHVTSKVDKKKGRKVCFIRSGAMFKRIWSYKLGTKRANALIAVLVFQLFVLFANIAPGSKGHELQIIMVHDMSEQGCLDFCAPIEQDFAANAVDFFCAADGVIIFAGLPLFGQLFFKLAVASVPQSVSEEWVILKTRSEVEDYVELSDIPEWYFDEDGNGALFEPNDKRNTWQWEKCLDDAADIKVKDIFLPGPWLDGVEERKAASAHRAARLESFEEDEEDDEW